MPYIDATEYKDRPVLIISEEHILPNKPIGLMITTKTWYNETLFELSSDVISRPMRTKSYVRPSRIYNFELEIAENKIAEITSQEYLNKIIDQVIKIFGR